MERAVTTLLDALGIVLLAAGLAGGLWPWVGWWGLCAAGVVVLVGSGVAEARHRTTPVDPRLTEGEVPG